MQSELDLPTQAQLMEALKRPAAFDHPMDDLRHLQTHISHVLLAGDFAYKIKKPLDLGFLDFSTLERRHHCCAEELRLNSRLAPSIYLQVVPITGTLEDPRFGGEGPILDYAVKMRRFPQEALLSGQPITASLIDRIAARAAQFHQTIPGADPASEFGNPEQVFFPMGQNFDQIRGLVDDPKELARLEPLEAWTRARWEHLTPLLRQRKDQGHIRECHGDMHLGNIALVDGEVAIFDGIEFNPDLRWIDTINEVAFLVMDLEQAGHTGLARRALNHYLELSGDYPAVPLIDFYKVYRALVRAKVTAIRLGQAGLGDQERAAVLAEYGRYLALAEGYIQPRKTALIITHGVSGSGKTLASGALLEQIPAIRVRSDVERKRLFGLAPQERSGSARDGGIYLADATSQTYARLQDLARTIVKAGYGALVDATFLKHSQRDAFHKLAVNLGCPFLILSLDASVEQLRARVNLRQAMGTDASEANVEILEQQLRSREPLSDQERAHAMTLDALTPLPLERIQDYLANG